MNERTTQILLVAVGVLLAAQFFRSAPLTPAARAEEVSLLRRRSPAPLVAPNTQHPNRTIVLIDLDVDA